MAGYRFFARADVAQDTIWRDTCEAWGQAQADSYIRGLHSHLRQFCDNRLLWRRLPQNLAIPSDVARKGYFSRYQHHYVLFRELDDGDVGAMSILHERMDLPVRLKDDLAALDVRAAKQE